VIEYTDDDFDELYEKIDITEDGLVSKAEMRNFLKKLGSKKAP
jgi:Ca2+-binding EF-hand superfamily protein